MFVTIVCAYWLQSVCVFACLFALISRIGVNWQRCMTRRVEIKRNCSTVKARIFMLRIGIDVSVGGGNIFEVTSFCYQEIKVTQVARYKQNIRLIKQNFILEVRTVISDID